MGASRDSRGAGHTKEVVVLVIRRAVACALCLMFVVVPAALADTVQAPPSDGPVTAPQPPDHHQDLISARRAALHQYLQARRAAHRLGIHLDRLRAIHDAHPSAGCSARSRVASRAAHPPRLHVRARDPRRPHAARSAASPTVGVVPHRAGSTARGSSAGPTSASASTCPTTPRADPSRPSRARTLASRRPRVRRIRQPRRHLRGKSPHGRRAHAAAVVRSGPLNGWWTRSERAADRRIAFAAPAHLTGGGVPSALVAS